MRTSYIQIMYVICKYVIESRGTDIIMNLSDTFRIIVKGISNIIQNITSALLSKLKTKLKLNKTAKIGTNQVKDSLSLPTSRQTVNYNPMDSITLYSTTNYNIISTQFTSHATVRSYHYITVIRNESKSILIQNCIIIIKEYRSSRP